MGGFDPQAVMNFLNAAGGNASGYAPSAPSPSPAPSSAATAGQNLTAGIKGYLSNIFYNLGEQAKPALGMPTDAEQSQIDALHQQRMAAIQQTNNTLQAAAALPGQIDQAKQAMVVGNYIRSLPSDHPVKTALVSSMTGQPDPNAQQGTQSGQPGSPAAVNGVVTVPRTSNALATAYQQMTQPPTSLGPAQPQGSGLKPFDVLGYLRDQAIAQSSQLPPSADLSALAQPGQQPNVKLSASGRLKQILAGGLTGFSNAEFAHFGIPTTYQQDVMQGQRQLQAAQTGETQARTAQMQTQVPVTIPGIGTVYMGQNLAAKGLAPTIAGQYRLTAQQMQDQTRLAVADLQSGRLGKLVLGTDPNTNAPGYQKFDRNGNSMGWIDNAIVPDLLERTKQTIDWKQDAYGNLHPMPVTTTTGPNLPGAGGQNAPGGQRGLPPMNQGEDVGAYLNRIAQPGETPTDTMQRLMSGMQSGSGPGKATRQSGARPNSGFTGANSMVPVIGFDNSGNQVFTDAGSAPSMGLTQVRKAGAAEAEKVTNARNMLVLLDNNDPNNPGVMQLINAADQQGLLGPISGRWNEFLSGKVGTGNPIYTALRTKLNGLSTTALMQVHVGARGGSNLLEHFADLANSGKMDAANLRSAVGAEQQYVREKAMLPGNFVRGNQAPANGSQYGFVPSQ